MPPDTHTTLTFDSNGATCAAWLTRPSGPGPHPGLVLVHGFGASGRFPRQRLSLRKHRQDVDAAFEFLAGGAPASVRCTPYRWRPLATAWRPWWCSARSSTGPRWYADWDSAPCCT